MNRAHPPDSQSTHVVDSAPETNHTPISIYERDPTYYYPDGNIVFLADGVLFRVYAFLVLPVDSISSTAKNIGQRYPLGVDDLPEKLTDSSDIYPIALPHITATQFRRYLLALLGRIYDPEYCSLVTDTKAKEKHSQDLLVHLLDIADVSRQFGMDKLKEWALSQLEIVLESMEKLLESSWDKNTLLRLHSCARSSERTTLSSSATSFIQYFISVSAAPEDKKIRNEHASSNLDACVQLFNDPDLLMDDPTLFGCAFVSILALGYRSAAWVSGITGSQRAILYAAQVQLTTPDTASNEDPYINMLLFDERDPGPQFLLCNPCIEGFRNSWNLSLRKYGELKSAGSLRGLTALARLPQYRRLFSIGLAPHSSETKPEPSVGTISFYTSQAKDYVLSSEPYYSLQKYCWSPRDGAKETCMGPERPFSYLDNQIQLVYQELAELYKDIASQL